MINFGKFSKVCLIEDVLIHDSIDLFVCVFYFQMMLPGFGFGELFDLFIEVIDNFLMLSLEQMGCFFRFQMDIFKKFAHLDNFNITFTVDVKLKKLYKSFKI